MADVRSVVVRLKAETTQFTAQMAAAGKSAQTALNGAVTAADKNKKALTQVGNAAGIMGAAAALGVGIAVKSAADFDKAMSGVSAATRAGGKEMENLRGLALKLGADTVFSATEAADGIEQLAKAGVETADIMGGGLKGALSLAAAGEIEVGDAAEVAATAMTQFGLEGAQIPHVADLLAAAAGKAQGEVGDFGMALKQSGLVANQTGLSIEETTGALAAFASQGLIGSDAGTSLKTMLQSLTPSSEKAASAMEQYNIEAYDGQGNFIGLEKYAGKLREGLAHMSDEQRNATMKTIFGSDAVRAASVLYEQGAGGIDKWIGKVNDAGFAAETAAKKQDNLAGDLEKLKGALSTALIETGSGAQGPLRGLTQDLTGIIDKFNELPQPVKNTTLAFGALVAVTGGAAFLGSRFLIAIAEAKTSLTALGVTSARTKLALTGIGKGLTLAATLYGIAKLDDAVDAIFDTDLEASGLEGDLIDLGRTGEISGQLLRTFGGDLGRFTRDIDKMEGGLVSAKGGFQGLTDAAVGWLPGTTGLEATERRINQLDASLTALIKGGKGAQAAATFKELAAAAKRQGISLEVLLEHMPRYASALDNQEDKQLAQGRSMLKTANWVDLVSGALDRGTGANDQNTQATRRNAAAIGAQVRRLNDAVEAQRKAAQEAVQSVYDRAGMISQLKETRKEIAQGTQTLNWNTKAGVNNRVALADLADQWNNSSGKVQDAKGAYGDMRDEFIKLARQAGATREQAKRLADRLLQVPPNTRSEVELPGIKRVMDELRDLRGGINDIPDGKPKINLDTRQARQEMAAWARDMAGKLRGIEDEDVRIKLATSAASILQTAKGLNIFGANTGGPVPLWGEPHRDSVLGALTPNEHVATEPEVKAAGKGDVKRGHQVWQAIRKMALRGELMNFGDLQYLNVGGSVGVRPRVSSTGEDAAAAIAARLAAGLADQLGAALSDRLNEKLKYVPGGGRPLGPGGTFSPGQVVKMQQFAQAQQGMPYQWGGTGNPSWDCSGLVGGAWNVGLGRSPNTRAFTTASFGTGAPYGFRPGGGIFTVGNDPGSHMASNVGGLGVESRGGDGVVLGSGITPLSSFAHMAHYDSGGVWPNNTFGVNTSGGDEIVLNPRKMADGGEVTPAERRENRQERREKRQETAAEAREKAREDRKDAREKAREEEREARQLARERERARKSGLRGFNISGREDRGETRSELGELRSTIREAFGKDSRAVGAINKMSDRLLKNAEQGEKLRRANEKLGDRLEGLRDRRRDYASSVAENFRVDPFQGGLADFDLQTRADTNDARRSRRALATAENKGLSGGLFKELAASGNFLLQQEFARLSRREIAAYERQFATRQAASARVGGMAGTEVYGAAVRENTRDLRRSTRETRENTRQMKRLGRVLEHRVERRTGGARRRARSS